MGNKFLSFIVALFLHLCICEHVRAQCTQPSFPSNNVVLIEKDFSIKSFEDGNTATFECILGHRPAVSNAQKSVTCSGGAWSILELNCIKKSCGSPPDFHNGRYYKTGILFGDTITPVCNTGYMLAGYGPKIRVCRDKGWDGRDPLCEVVKCDAPPAIENGFLEDQPLESYDYLQVVTYKCNKGLSLVGNSQLHCSENGTFKPEPPKCVDGCPKPEIPNSRRIGGKAPPYKLNHFITYACEENYSLIGKDHIVCTENGWNPDPPKCIAQEKPTTTARTHITSQTTPPGDGDGNAQATTATTARTHTTSKAAPPVEEPSSSLLRDVLIGLGVTGAVIILVCCGCYWKKKRSKREYSHEGAKKREEEML